MRHTRIAKSIVVLAALLPGQAMSAEDPLLKDLASAIAVLGLPCGPVVSASRQAENDHIATCKNGNRYRVFINPQGRVVALKQ